MTRDAADALATAAAPQDVPAPDGAHRAAPARLYGQPLLHLPRDLYIPPDALEVFLEAFEGPLDLLLYLIRRQDFDVLDIPMAEVTRQYLAYIDEIRARDLELAADYLLMAAMLIDIKSRMLLPARTSAADGEEAEDPRAELARRLLDYERMKRAAQALDALPQAGRDVHPVRVLMERGAPPLPNVEPEDLRRAFADVMRRAKLVQHHRITREALSVREHMTILMRALSTRRFAEFRDLFDVGRGLPVVVVTFVALLELARELVVEITQAEAFAPIYVRLAGTTAS